MNISIQPTTRIVDIARALHAAGYRMVNRPGNGVQIERYSRSGDCDLCGRWTGELIEGACAPCKHHIENNDLLRNQR